MIAHILHLARWEWYKLQRRRMLWILLIIAIVIPQLAFWGGYATYRSGVMLDSSSYGFSSPNPDGTSVDIHMTCRDLVEGTLPQEIENLPERDRENARRQMEEFRSSGCESSIEAHQEMRAGLSVPGSIVGGLVVAHGIGVVLIMILASSAIGVEYGWGTLRTALVRGVGRWQFLTAKALLIAILGAAGLLVVSVAIGVSSVIATLTLESSGEAVSASGEWSSAAVAFGKSIYGLIPYIALATLFAVLTSSSGVGISIAVGYYIAEGIVVAILLNFDWFERVSHFILGPAVNGWLDVPTAAIGPGAPVIGEMPEPLQSALVMLGYIVILGGIVLWVFQRRDVAGAKGG